MAQPVNLKAAREWFLAPCLQHLKTLETTQTATAAKSGLDLQRVDKASQILLAMEYRERAAQGRPLPRIDDVGFSNFSQFDEDGILLFLFSVIGTRRKLCVEICAGVGYESMSANLIINHNWEGLLVDGDPSNVEKARAYFANCRETWWQQPKVAQAWITRDGINDLIRGHGIEGEIDLLSLDMDGVEYWIWESITVVNPRVLVVEINDLWPADVAVTVRYQDDFRYSDERRGYCGASLGAWVKSCRKRGYRLVGCNRNGLNCFFVRNDIAPELIPEVPAEACLSRLATREKQAQAAPIIAGHDWVPV